MKTQVSIAKDIHDSLKHLSCELRIETDDHVAAVGVKAPRTVENKSIELSESLWRNLF